MLYVVSLVVVKESLLNAVWVHWEHGNRKYLGIETVEINWLRASSSVRIEHQPSKLSELVISKEFLNYLEQRYPNKRYARYQLSLLRRFSACYHNPSLMLQIKETNRNNVLKACAVYAKFLGDYEAFRSRLRSYDVGYVNRSTCFNGFLSMINKKHSDLPNYISEIKSTITSSEYTYLKFLSATGLCPSEAFEAFNMIKALYEKGELGSYYNESNRMLEHYKYPKFLRSTKSAFMSVVDGGLIDQIICSDNVSYPALHCRLDKAHKRLRLKEIRSYNATYLLNSGLGSFEVDLLQGRVSRSVLARHYVGVDVTKLAERVLPIQFKLCSSLGLDL